MSKTEITTTTSGFLKLHDFNMSAAMAEELDGLNVNFERIKIPAGGSTVFELPGEETDEPEMAKEFSGVILWHHPLFAFYTDKYTGANNPPVCGSFDGMTGEGVPGGSCAKCPHNQFGSGENGSKACKNRRRIYVLREGEIFPLLLSLPTGSLKEFTRYIKRLLGKAILNSSRAGDLVLDLFGGSGTTLIAAEQTGRQCCMMELDPKYCDVIVKRYIEQCGSAGRVFLLREGIETAYEDVSSLADFA